MSSLSTLPKGDSAWLFRKAIERIMQQVSVLETNIGSSTTGNSADTQIIFNDAGTLRGDTGLVYNKTTDALTVAGLVTAGSATITGAATVGTTLGVTGDLTASSDVLVNGNEKYVYLYSTYTIGQNPRVRFRAVGAGGGSGYGGDFRISTRKPDNNWNTDALTVDSSANVNVALGNVVMGTSGKGIDFSATANSSGTMTSELLADYEEGTFTATLKGGTTDPTIAVTTTGKYTKIGNQVFVRIMFGNVSTLGASGAISITGLPFTSATTPEQIGYLMVENMATFTNSSLSSYLPASSTTLSLYTSTSNSIITAITHNAGVARYLWAAITYTAA
jgi:hypothetical protein